MLHVQRITFVNFVADLVQGVLSLGIKFIENVRDPQRFYQSSRQDDLRKLVHYSQRRIGFVETQTT